MADKRIITSGIWQDDFFGSLNMMQRLLWIGLFSKMADDQGRMIDNPQVISSFVFSYDGIPAKEIDAALNVFTEAGKILRYVDGTKKYIQIINWWDHQQGQWAMPSKHPAPLEWQDRVRSYIKGVYHELNWPKKTPKKDDTPETPPGDATLTDHVDGHNPDPEINPDPDPKNMIKDIAPPARVEETPFDDPIPEGVKNPGAYRALQKFEARQALGEKDYSWLPENFRPMAQAFYKASGIDPTSRERGLWHKSLLELYEMQATPADIEGVTAKMRRNRLTIKSPMSIVATVRDYLTSKTHDGERWNE